MTTASQEHEPEGKSLSPRVCGPRDGLMLATGFALCLLLLHSFVPAPGLNQKITLPQHRLNRSTVHIWERRAAPTRGVTTLASLSIAAAHMAEPMRWGGKGVVPFVSGNDAMVEFMLNEMLHVARHAVPFNILWVPLDAAALSRLEKDGHGTVWDGIAKEGKFSGKRSDFRKGDYNKLALIKWDIAISLLDLGYDVLLLDPDLVLHRNPLPYFETLGTCDISIQLDSTMDPTRENIMRNGLSNFNTGGILMRSFPRLISWVKDFHNFAEAQYKDGAQIDDQALFNRFVGRQHALLLDTSSHESPGNYTIKQVMQNDCLRFYKNAGNGSEAVSIYPLSPYMFLPRPGLQTLRLPQRITHRAFWWHANYAASIGGKLRAIKAEGDWLLY